MPLRVLSIAFPFAPVGPAGVGGAEQILSHLDRALVAAGHASTVIAAEGSQIAGTLIPIPIPAVLDDTAQSACRRRVQALLHSAIRTDPPDLIHMHGLDFHQYTLPADIPVIVTLHLPIAWYPQTAWASAGENLRFCCVSESQRRTCPPQLENVIVIENGVPIPPPRPERPREHFALVLGRICPEKNAHQALDAGTQAGIPVYLAGQVFPYPEHQQYFDKQIAPRLRGGTPQHRFLGPIGPEQRNNLLAAATCLLHPTLAPETSSLVAMEALAAGTPVIAYRSGALPDIVDDGITGFLVNNIAQMAAVIRNAPTISPQACRETAARRFSKDRMVRQYLDLYQSMVRAPRREALHA